VRNAPGTAIIFNKVASAPSAFIICIIKNGNHIILPALRRLSPCFFRLPVTML
jgi:hypothetical protein